MDRESTIELQKIDCNCNDCIFMQRDNELFKQSIELHRKWALDYFTTIKNKRIEKAYWHLDKKQDRETFEAIMKEANAMRFQFDKKSVSINYGSCTKFNKPVSFIPNILQLDTQDCFAHRRTN